MVRAYNTGKKNALSVFVEKSYNENYFHNNSLMVYRKPIKVMSVLVQGYSK
jgi:hypothetical protein